MSNIQESFEMWLDGDFRAETLEVTPEQLEQWLETQLDEIDGMVKGDQEEQAFARLIQVTSFINTLWARKPSIIGWLSGQVTKYKNTLLALAKSLIADSFSISVGLPAGISLSLSWNLPKKPSKPSHP